MTHLNPETKVINPELVLECARMAYQKATWFISDRHGSVGTIITRIDDHEDENEMPLFKPFDPLSYNSDAWALERALKNRENGEWSFGKTIFSDTKHKANSPRHGSAYDESDTLLLLKCVSAMRSIPLYLEDGK